MELGRPLAEVRRSWVQTSRVAAKRLLGEVVPPDEKPAQQAKKRRVKTYVTEIEMSNMLFMSTGKSIAYFNIEKDADGEYPDAYTWPHLNACLDRASPNVAMDSHLGYGHLKFNVHVDWDLEHDTKNSSNAAMRDTGLWRGHVSLVSAHNCTYGSALSPARHDQITD